MIKHTQQDWTIGHTVKVGFMTLTVLAAIATPGDRLPDTYLLASKTGFYEFMPHRGLRKIPEAEAKEKMERGRQTAQQIAQAALEKAARESAHSLLVIELMGA